MVAILKECDECGHMIDTEVCPQCGTENSIDYEEQERFEEDPDDNY
jgi:ribosomal protein L32